MSETKDNSGDVAVVVKNGKAMTHVRDNSEVETVIGDQNVNIINELETQTTEDISNHLAMTKMSNHTSTTNNNNSNKNKNNKNKSKTKNYNRIERQMSDFEDIEMNDKDSSSLHKDASWKKYVMYTFGVTFRSLSVIDLGTDVYLLSKTLSYNGGDDKEKREILFVTITLFVTIICPYVLSYSSGIKLFLFRKSFYQLSGFYSLLIVFYLFPTGVLYFVFLDLLDVLLNVYRWILLIVFNWGTLEITKLEETLGMCVICDVGCVMYTCEVLAVFIFGCCCRRFVSNVCLFCLFVAVVCCCVFV